MGHHAYAPIKSTRQLTIGELSLKIKGADLAAQLIDTAVAAEFDVLVEYTYRPFEEATRDSESIPAECTVKAVRAVANIHFTGEKTDTIVRRGEDLLDLFSGSQVTALEDQILAAIEKGRGDE